jgi:rare lipoprotein A
MPQMPAQARAAAIPPIAEDSLEAHVSYPNAEITGATIVPGRSYRLQIGSFKVAKNAVDVFDRLAAAGLNPSWEMFDDYYRVVILNVRAETIPQISARLGNAGFREVIAREER